MSLDLVLILTISMTVVILLLLLNSEVYAVTANTTDFLIQVPSSWVYRENFRLYKELDNNIILTPNDFADKLLPDNVYNFDVMNGTFAELAADHTFPIKNAPLEMYLKHATRFSARLPLRYENATVGGEKAIKVFMNSTDLVNAIKLTNKSADLSAVPTLITLSYFVIHNDQPYYLNYQSNATKDYQKYLPEFEQMVKTFKFAK
jgi:hypothetical protein